VFCSNRGQRGGCGRTFAFFLAEVLPRHTFTAVLLWQWLVKLLAALSLKAVAEKLRLPFALETLYRLRRKLRQWLDSALSEVSLITVTTLSCTFPPREKSAISSIIDAAFRTVFTGVSNRMCCQDYPPHL
jgi:hypothetical protein